MLKWGLRYSFLTFISVKNGCFLSDNVLMWLVVYIVTY